MQYSKDELEKLYLGVDLLSIYMYDRDHMEYDHYNGSIFMPSPNFVTNIPIDFHDSENIIGFSATVQTTSEYSLSIDCDICRLALEQSYNIPVSIAQKTLEFEINGLVNNKTVDFNDPIIIEDGYIYSMKITCASSGAYARIFSIGLNTTFRKY